jgi:hypothetical protein
MARQFNQFIKNRYQQTWHTIEFSNNRHTRHHPNQTFRIAPEQLFKLTRFHTPTQIHVPGSTPAEKPAPPGSSDRKSRWILVLILGVWPPAVTSSSLSPSRRLGKHYTYPAPTATRPNTRRTRSGTLELPGFLGRSRRPTGPPWVRIIFMDRVTVGHAGPGRQLLAPCTGSPPPGLPRPWLPARRRRPAPGPGKHSLHKPHPQPRPRETSAKLPW